VKAPKQPKAPKAPGQPKAPGAKKGKYESKTGNAECSNAMSVWQKAIRSGNSPGQQVYAKLAQCRASVRTNKQNANKVAVGTMKQSAATAVVNRSDSRITDNLATAKARKERLKSLVQQRATRQISTADRQKAMDVAAKVTGNQTSPSAGLKRLQKVTKPRAAKATTTTAPKPSSRGVQKAPDKVAALVARVRGSANHAANRTRAVNNQKFQANVLSASRGPNIPYRVLAERQGAAKTADLVARVRGTGNVGNMRKFGQFQQQIIRGQVSARTGPQIPGNVLAARQGASKVADLVAKVRQSPRHMQNKVTGFVAKGAVTWKRMTQGPQIPKPIMAARKGAITRAAKKAAAAPAAAASLVTRSFSPTGPKLPAAPVMIVPGSRGTPSHVGQSTYQGDLMETLHQKGNRTSLMWDGHSDAVATAASDRLQARAKSEGMTVQNRMDRLRDLRAQRKQGLAANADPDNLNPTLSSGVSLVQWHSTDRKITGALDPSKTQTHHYSRGVYSDQNLPGSAQYGSANYAFKPPKGSVLQYQSAPRTVQSRRAIEAISKATGTNPVDVQKTLQRLNGPGQGSGGTPTYGTQNIIRLAGAAQKDAKGTAKMIQAHNASGIPGSGGTMYDVTAEKVLSGFAGVTVDTATAGRATSRKSNYNSWFHPITPTRVTKASMKAGQHDDLFQPGAMNRKIKLLRGPTSARDMLIGDLRS